MTRGSLIVRIVSGLAAVALIGFTIMNQISNPMDSRAVSLETEIENLDVRPVFYVASASVDYDELDAHLKSHPKLWQQLVPPKKEAAPRATGPNFKRLLEGVVPSIRREIKQGGQIKVHTITPSKPRGFWAKEGDVINGAKIVKITPTHFVFEKSQNKKPYKYNHPRR